MIRLQEVTLLYYLRNTLVGDAQTMSDHAHGGNDTLINGTATSDDMWGDAQVMLGNAQGGNDTFVFRANNAHDVIEDFGQAACVAGSNLGTDHIDVSALGIHDFADFDISAFDPKPTQYDHVHSGQRCCCA